MEIASPKIKSMFEIVPTICCRNNSSLRNSHIRQQENLKVLSG